MKNYDGGVDYKFLEAMHVKVVRHQPWQLGLTHPDLKGKFVRYPRKGTLMFEWEFQGERKQAKIGETGDFKAQEEGEATENVYEVIMQRVNEQQNG